MAGEYGEPWRSGPGLALLNSAGKEILIYTNPHLYDRVVSCVNALDGRDPVKFMGQVRELAKAAYSAGEYLHCDSICDRMTAALAPFREMIKDGKQ